MPGEEKEILTALTEELIDRKIAIQVKVIKIQRPYKQQRKKDYLALTLTNQGHKGGHLLCQRTLLRLVQLLLRLSLRKRS